VQQLVNKLKKLINEGQFKAIGIYTGSWGPTWGSPE